MANNEVTFQEFLAIQNVLLEWADSYDTKDWPRLRKILAPSIELDYRSFLDKHWPSLSVEEFVEIVKAPDVLGSPRLRTQHFASGASKYYRTGPNTIVGHHQLRVPHIWYQTEEAAKKSLESEAISKGHAHSVNVHRYERVNGEWKLAGLAVDIRWSEWDFESVFAAGREELQRAERAKL